MMQEQGSRDRGIKGPRVEKKRKTIEYRTLNAKLIENKGKEKNIKIEE
jgi:hypothetical protein